MGTAASFVLWRFVTVERAFVMYTLRAMFCLLATVFLLPLGGAAAPLLPDVGGRNPMQFPLSLAHDPQGDVWVGTEADGVWRCDSVGHWTHFTTADGLGEDSGTALVCDEQGRIWAGHRTRGVSVFNGTFWQNYDSLTGPLGGRVFALAVCPTDGDVWSATDRGLARWSPTTDTWNYYTRAGGLPDDQATALAFAKDGTLYLGTQVGRIAVASPHDGYQAWRIVGGTPRGADAPQGAGLPSPLVNALLVTRDGALYAGTTRGLAGSLDGGRSWRYLRGQDWLAKAQQRTVPAPAPLPTPKYELMSEDYVTTLAEDAAGLLWIGHRHLGTELYDPHTGWHSPVSDLPVFDYVRALIVPDGVLPWVADYGLGLFAPGPATVFAETSPSLPLPSPAGPPDLATLTAMAEDAAAHETPLAAGAGEFLGDDWTTQGDWVGRYGRQYALLCGMQSPGDQVYALDPAYKVDLGIGPHTNSKYAGIWYYISTLSTADPRILYDPAVATRRDAEVNDGSWQIGVYPRTWEGPDLWVTVQVPAGPHRVSLYFVNDDGHTVNSDPTGGREADNRLRDYTLELKSNVASVADAEMAPALARTRVFDFYEGVYKQFLVQGPSRFFFKIGRNNSFVTKLQGVFVDRLTDAPPSGVPNGLEAGVRYGPPPVASAATASATLAAAQTLWTALDEADGSESGAALDAADRILAYRAAVAADAPPALLADWRWNLRLWTPGDRVAFAQAMSASAQAAKSAAH